MTEAEQLVREFAEKFPTPNVLLALGLCETGVLSWEDVAEIYGESLIDAIAKVISELN